MNIIINKCEIEAIKDKLKENIYNFISPIDSYLENHIFRSQHYEIYLDKDSIGYFSIFNEELLTQFYIEKEHRALSQIVFDRIRRYENVQRAYIPTCDEFFLSHGIDFSKKVDIQAYFFQDTEIDISEDEIANEFYLRVAMEEDIELIQKTTGDFFDNLTSQIKKQEIYLGFKAGKVVSCGVMEASKIYDNIASIGMFTMPGDRRSGIGRSTLLELKKLCYRKGITPVAGCWYFNHNSKKTLESAGMYSQTRLLSIHL